MISVFQDKPPLIHIFVFQVPVCQQHPTIFPLYSHSILSIPPVLVGTCPYGGFLKEWVSLSHPNVYRIFQDFPWHKPSSYRVTPLWKLQKNHLMNNRRTCLQAPVAPKAFWSFSQLATQCSVMPWGGPSSWHQIRGWVLPFGNST